MLANPHASACRASSIKRHEGLVLIIVLIVMVAMTLAGISLMRSVNTGTLVASNMAFRRSAVYASDIGVEAAIAWLQINSGGNTLYSDIPTSGYFAKKGDPSAGQSWDDYWASYLDPDPVSRPVTVAVNSGNVMTLPTDTGAVLSSSTNGSGTTVSYVIHRLCTIDPSHTGTDAAPTDQGVHCAVSPAVASSSNNSMGAGSIPLKYNNQVYYRITTRVEGPHNTVAYTQTIIAL